MIHIDKNTLDMELVQGRTGTFSITPKLNGEKVDGVVWFTMRKTKDSNIVIQKEVTITDGVATIELPPSETTYLDPARYSYDLVLVRPDGNTDTLLPNKQPFANFTVKKGVK